MPDSQVLNDLKVIDIQVIEHKIQRYETVGDYWYPYPYKMKLRVSDMGNEDYEFLVIIHELIEAHLCRKHGVAEPNIKAFDEQFERDRLAGNHPQSAEPGNDPDAPYRKEHELATEIEKAVAVALGVDWAMYSEVVERL